MRASIAVGPVVLDVRHLRVLVDGLTVQLPAREAELMAVLMGNAGRLLTTAKLAQVIEPNSAHVARAECRARRLVCGLSRRLLVRPTMPPLIERVSDVGFRFALIEPSVAGD